MKPIVLRKIVSVFLYTQKKHFYNSLYGGTEVCVVALCSLQAFSAQLICTSFRQKTFGFQEEQQNDPERDRMLG